MKYLRINLHWQILIAFVLAVFFALLFPEYVYTISWTGTLFLRLLTMIIVPLIVSSIISGIANIGNADNLSRLGGKTIFYYLSTSLLAILTGLFFVNIIQPGKHASLGLQAHPVGLVDHPESLWTTIIEIVPTNFFQSLMQADMLQIIFFSILFGFFIIKAPEKSKNHLSEFFNALFEVMMNITLFVIRFAPIGIFGIVAKIVAEQENFYNLVGTMGMYMLTVLVGLLFHSFITLALTLKFVGGVHPIRHFKAVSTALLTAFSTSSSSATLPLTISEVENKCGVSNKISSFTLPLGATINMDGTALYELVAVIFIAQQYGMDLSFGQQLIVVLTALLASIGAAGIPMAGLVMMTIILKAVNLPLEGIGLILAVDRILDMFRTAVNVWSDTCGAVIIAKSEGEKLNV